MTLENEAVFVNRAFPVQFEPRGCIRTAKERRTSLQTRNLKNKERRAALLSFPVLYFVTVFVSTLLRGSKVIPGFAMLVTVSV